MNRPGTYILSLILSVMTVFALLACIGTTVAKINVTPGRAIALTRENDISSAVRSGLEKYWSEQYNSSHIPAEVYLDQLSEGDIQQLIENRISEGFSAMSSGSSIAPASLDGDIADAIERFYSDYADENGFKKDDDYTRQLTTAQQKANAIIEEYCDVYKFSSLSSHGVLSKMGAVYRRLTLLMVCAYILFAVLAGALLLVCRKEKKSVLYWLGASGTVAGALGTFPCAYLLISGYFKAFTIKQPHIYTTYTSAMTAGTSAFMAASIALAAAGAALLIVYGVLRSKNRKVKPTDISSVK